MREDSRAIVRAASMAQAAADWMFETAGEPAAVAAAFACADLRPALKPSCPPDNERRAGRARLTGASGIRPSRTPLAALFFAARRRVPRRAAQILA
jgi:hypothetical protein